MQPPRELRILAALYGFNAIYCSAFEAWIFYWMVTTGGWIFLIMQFILLLGICFVFSLATYGVLMGRGWVSKFGLVLSVVSVALMLSLGLLSIRGVVKYLLSHPGISLVDILSLSSLSLLVTNPLCIYYLTRPQVKQYLGSKVERLI